jgi:ABC-type antimicrobial peptide transport system permease subunit
LPSPARAPRRVGLFGVVGLAAAYLPARRATRVEVLRVLKEE